MKDLTHYFQSPHNTSNSSKSSATKTASKGKRKASESEDEERAKSAIRNEDSPEEVFKAKKPRKSNSSAKKKSTKLSLNVTPITDGISDDENTPLSKRTKKSNKSTPVINYDISSDDNTPLSKRTKKSNKSTPVINNDTSSDENTPLSELAKKCNSNESKPVTKVDFFDDENASQLFKRSDKKVRTYQRKKPRKVAETIQDFEFKPMGFSIVLHDCLLEKSPQKKTNGSFETEGSDSDSCFVPDKKSKRSTKSKIEKEEEPGKNNLFNYFSKVDKTRNSAQKKNQTTITVQAIVHPPPTDKSKLIKERNLNVPEVAPATNKNSKKQKNYDFDELKVVETEIIEVNKNSKNSEPVPTTPQLQIENVSPENTSSKSKSWKMRVKLTPSSVLNDSISKKIKSKNYKKIILPSNSSDEEDPETQADSKSEDNEVEFVSISKLEDPAKPDKVTKTPTVNLAPIFCKKNDTKNTTTNRIKISDEAKRQFLESGVPDAIRKKMEEQKIVVEDEYKGEYVFPKCNHVQQKDTESFVWKLQECSDFKLKEPETDTPMEDFSSESWSSLISTDVKVQPTQNVVQKFEFDLKDEINSLKKLEQIGNVSDIHSSIKRLKKVSESMNGVCWTEKYQPFVFGDMIGNTNSLLALKEWVESHKNMRQVFFANDSSSGGEFMDSDDSCCSTDAKDNVAILVGPPGCGKTCAVYMIANELGFKVLEVNAGWNRAGKKIIDELLEATQSHRVKRTSGSIFTSNSKPEKSKKKKKNSKETKKDKKTMSLILIEDADILFENHDEGFLSALNSLTSISKRPLIFTVNTLNCPHLNKYNNSQNRILKFDYPLRPLINIWLRVIALLEGVQLTDEVMIELYKIAGSDMRKNLLQLQVLVQSKCQYPKPNNEQLFYQDWFSHVRCLGDKRIAPKPTVCTENAHDKLFSDDESAPSDDFKKPFSKEEAPVKPKSITELRDDREALLKTTKFLDYVANLDHFVCDNDQNLFPLSGGYLAKNEDYSTYRLNNDIVEFIKNNLFEKYTEKTPFSFKKYYNAVTQNSRIKTVTENVFLSLNPRVSNRQARSCDYLPTIREIARCEKNKTPPTSSLRRSTRYFGYLKSINVDLSDKDIEILRSTFAL